MAFSVNTNRSAMVALQSLNATNKGLDQVQKRVSTGMSVSSTKDDSATFITAQGLRGKVSDMKAVTSSLNNAKSVVDVAVSGAEQISDTVNQMKTLAKQASDTTLTTDQRTSLNADFVALRDQVNVIVNGSEFNGANVLRTTPATGTVGSVSALQSLNNTNTGTGYTPDTVQVGNQGLTLAATGTNTLIATSTLGSTASDAQTMVANIDAYNNTTLKPALSVLGSASRQIDAQLSFNSKLNDTLESGIGNLVDADMAKESAKLTALQTKQQLGMTALSMANQGPSAVSQLFRG